MAEEHTDTADQAAMEADFDAGFTGTEGKTKKSPLPVSDKPAAPPQEPSDEEPEIVKITRKDWDEVQAAARRTATYEHQFSKLHGTTGKIQQVLNELRTQTPRDLEVKMPDQAFAKMAKDFPELAELSREEFSKVLANLKVAGNATPDPEAIKKTLMDLEKEDLEDAYPDWAEIVGAVNDRNQADPDHPFRKWLAAKPAAYQDRINGTIRAPVIQRAIRLYQSETKAAAQKAAAATPRNDARAERISAAVQPRGDRSVTSSASTRSDEEEFAAGFNSR